MAERRTLIPELAGAGRLGRHVEHDARSARFRAAAPVDWKSISHKRHVPSFDQGNLGSCTIQAMVGCVDTAPFTRRITSQKTMRRLYSWETGNDEYDGEYPPDDTGSSALASMKTGVHAGYFTSYTWGFGWAEALGLLFDSPTRRGTPFAVGTVWLDTMDRPSVSGGTIRASDIRAGAVRGGHEYQAAGLRLSTTGTVAGGDLVECWQSWGVGLPPFYLTVAALDLLLSRQGDAVAPDA